MKISSFCPSGSGAYIVHKTLEENIPEYNLKEYDPKFEFFPFLFPLIFNHNNTDIIHSTPEYACFVPKKKSKLVLTFHNYVLDTFMKPYSSFYQRVHYKTDLKFFIKKSLEKADAVTSVSKFTAEILKKDFGYKGAVKIIYNGINTEMFKPDYKRKDNEKIKVLFSGNLTKRKGANFLVDIAKRLHKNITIFYTSGLRSRDSLPRLKNLRPIGRFTYAQMPDLYRSMDILLMPTVREGFGLAMAEAMACGLPVVVSNCSSIPEIAVDEKSGFLVDNFNIQSFSDSINTLAESYVLRKEIAKYNRMIITSKFNHIKMINSYNNFFKTIL